MTGFRVHLLSFTVKRDLISRTCSLVEDLEEPVLIRNSVSMRVTGLLAQWLSRRLSVIGQRYRWLGLNTIQRLSSEHRVGENGYRKAQSCTTMSIVQ
jgi:hypothetical protein